MKTKILFSILLLLLIGCIKPPLKDIENTPTQPPAEISIELSNVDMSFNNLILSFRISNLSDNRIWFPIGLNGKYSFFDPRNNKWEDVDDTMKVISLRPEIILEPRGDIINDNFLFSIAPDFPKEIVNAKQEIRFRVEFKGNRMIGEHATSFPVSTSSEFSIIIPQDE